jgi:hypothetical protein
MNKPSSDFLPRKILCWWPNCTAVAYTTYREGWGEFPPDGWAATAEGVLCPDHTICYEEGADIPSHEGTVC